MTQSEIDERTARLLGLMPSARHSQAENQIDIERQLLSLGLPPNELITYLRSCLNISAQADFDQPFFSKLMLLRLHDTFSNSVRSAEVVDFVHSSENITGTKRPPIEEARDTVQRFADRLYKVFNDLTSRLPTSQLLKEALKQLENEAARYGYEPLSRVAAVLHDVLRYTPIEAFDNVMLQGFKEALHQAFGERADRADPFACELALYKAGLDWLPPMPQWEQSDIEDEDDNTEE